MCICLYKLELKTELGLQYIGNRVRIALVVEDALRYRNADGGKGKVAGHETARDSQVGNLGHRFGGKPVAR